MMVQPPEPLANVVVQFLQPGPGPQHVDELTSQAVLFAFGKSALVTTASTPGTLRAALMSIFLILA